MGAHSTLRRVCGSAVVIGLLALGACGSETSEPAASTDAAPSADGSGMPECDEVWLTGETLPEGYAGCEQDGEVVKGDRIACSSGQTFITFADSHYAVLGGLVREVEGEIGSDSTYRKAVRSCRA